MNIILGIMEGENLDSIETNVVCWAAQTKKYASKGASIFRGFFNLRKLKVMRKWMNNDRIQNGLQSFKSYEVRVPDRVLLRDITPESERPTRFTLYQCFL